MFKSKIYFLILFLLGLMPSLESYNYYFIEPYERNYNPNYNEDAGGLRSRYGRSDGVTCGESNKSDCGSALGSAGSDPKKIAYGIAQKAALDAKAANDAQMGAAEAASHQVRAELAYKAQQSAKAAEAALAGKQQVLDQLRLELVDAETALASIQAAVPKFGDNAELMKSIMEKAEKQLAFTRKVIEVATNHLANDQTVAKGAQQEVVEKAAILNAAKQRVELINNRLAEATKDLEATKAAAYKASCAAVEAKQKAQRSRRDSWMYEEDVWR